MERLTNRETEYWKVIHNKDLALRKLLSDKSLPETYLPAEWFKYLAHIRDALGNLSNSLGFVATLLAKDYLADRFGISGFDAAQKAQGAPGVDIEVRTPDGLEIIAEIKTTKPYQPGFGANQKITILKDLNRLSSLPADHRIMFVTDQESFRTLCGANYRARFANVEVVNLLTGETSQVAS